MRWAVVLLAVIAPCSMGSADTDWGDISPITIVDHQAKKSFRQYWDEHFYGSISGFTSIGSHHWQYQTNVVLGYQKRWDVAKAVLEGLYRHQSLFGDVQTKQNANDTVIQQTAHSSYHQDWLHLRNAYIEYYPSQYISLSAGKHVIVWGQMDRLSPVDMILPIDLQTARISWNKSQTRWPQTTIKASIHPTPELTFTGYFFPIFEHSPWLSPFHLDANQSSDGNHWVHTTYASESSHALRMTWYTQHGTASVTYYNGFHNTLPVFKQTVHYNGAVSTSYGYDPKKAYGVALGMPLKSGASVSIECTLSNDFFYTSTTQSEVIHVIQTHHQGVNAIPIYRAVVAIGVDAMSDTWSFNAALLHHRSIRTNSMDAFWSAYDAIPNAATMDQPVIPWVHISRKWGTNRIIGVALGWLDQTLGSMVYVSHDLTESLSWTATAQSFGSFYHMVQPRPLHDSGNGTYYDYSYIEPSATFGLGYKL